jgi:3-methyladenine DNA glycosylase AlkC
MSESSAFKNFISPALVRKIAKQISLHDAKFPEREFIKYSAKLADLELKDRVRLLAKALQITLPHSYEKNISLLVRVAEESDLRGFDLWPFTQYIQENGLHNYRDSLEALTKLTSLFTSEFAVRPFLLKYPEQTVAYLKGLLSSNDEHVRRWISEGTRPRLPWGERLPIFIQNPKTTLELITPLRKDTSLYVRKSVANHLNDISKDHPEYLLSILERWNREKNLSSDEFERLRWITRHALRTLIKKGNKRALALIGVQSASGIQIKNLRLSKKVCRVGDDLVFSFAIKSSAKDDTKIVLDYAIHFQLANGKTSRKVFKMRNIILTKGEARILEKKHSLRKITTRRYYPGKHKIEIILNGDT